MRRIFTIMGMLWIPSYLIACTECDSSTNDILEEESNDYLIFQSIEESGALSDFWNLLEDQGYDV